MPKTQPVTPISGILPRVLEQLQADSRPSLETIRKIWKRLAGEKASRHSWPCRLTRGQLLIEAENSGWMYLLTLKKSQLLQGLVELLGAGRVKELHFRVGERRAG